MYKKKVIGSSILLLVLLLGLSTVCYASSYEFTYNDINNVVYNWFQHTGNYNDMTVVEDYIDSMQTTLENNYSSYINSSDYSLNMITSGSGSSMMLFINISPTYKKNNNYNVYSGGYFYINSVKRIRLGSTINNGNNNWNMNGDNFTNYGGTANKFNFLTDIYNNSSTTILHSAPYSNVDWLSTSGPYMDSYGWGVISYFYDTVTVPGIDVINSNVYLSYFNTINSPYQTWCGAWLGGADEIDSCVVKYWRYNYIADRWFQENNNLHGGFTDIDTTNNSTFFYIDENFLKSDSFVAATIKHKTDSSKNYIIYLYLASVKTVINNGTLDIAATFRNYNYSGDNAYNNNNNEIQQQEDNQSILDALTGTTASNITSGDLPLYTVDDPTANFFDYLVNRISNLFLTNEPVNINITIPYIMDNDYILSSDFFVLSGPLLLLINAFFIIWLIIPKINDVHEVIKAMQMGYSDTFIRYFGYGISINDLL